MSRLTMAVHNNVSTNISGGHRISPGGCQAGMWIVTYFPACADRCAIDVRSRATLAFHELTILVPVMANSRLDLIFGGSTHQSRMMPSYPQREKSQWSCVAIASCGDHRHMPPLGYCCENKQLPRQGDSVASPHCTSDMATLNLRGP